MYGSGFYFFLSDDSSFSYADSFLPEGTFVYVLILCKEEIGWHHSAKRSSLCDSQLQSEERHGGDPFRQALCSNCGAPAIGT